MKGCALNLVSSGPCLPENARAITPEGKALSQRFDFSLLIGDFRTTYYTVVVNGAEEFLCGRAVLVNRRLERS